MATNKHEELANWFFRLNGCLTIPNFVVHPEVGSDQRTDADLLAVRFPYRCELLSRPLEDHPLFTVEKTRLQVFFVEVKGSGCAINDTWRNPKSKNVNTIVSAIGFVPPDDVGKVADSIYATGQYVDNKIIARFICVGSKQGNLGPAFSNVPQILYPQILHFIYSRFHGHKKAKRSHPQWDDFGQTLYTEANKYLKPDEFCTAFLKKM